MEKLLEACDHWHYHIQKTAVVKTVVIRVNEAKSRGFFF